MEVQCSNNIFIHSPRLYIVLYNYFLAFFYISWYFHLYMKTKFVCLYKIIIQRLNFLWSQMLVLWKSCSTNYHLKTILKSLTQKKASWNVFIWLMRYQSKLWHRWFYQVRMTTIGRFVMKWRSDRYNSVHWCYLTCSLCKCYVLQSNQYHNFIVIDKNLRYNTTTVPNDG